MREDHIPSVAESAAQGTTALRPEGPRSAGRGAKRAEALAKLREEIAQIIGGPDFLAKFSFDVRKSAYRKADAVLAAIAKAETGQ